MNTTKVESKLRNLKRQKNIQWHVLERIEKAIGVNKTKLTFRKISDVMVQKLKSQGFHVEITPNEEREFSDRFKAEVSWRGLVEEMKKK